MDKWITAPVEFKDEAAGTVQAAFSVFNTIDSDGDVVKPSAFKDGQEVPMVWSHRWDAPIGKGTVHVGRKQATFDGHFFLDTQAGMEAYKTVKNMGALQEWSFGFRVLEDEEGEFDGQRVRFLKGLELFEVSPVLVGANRETRTLAIKGAVPDLSDLKDMMAEMRGAMGSMRTAMGRMERAMGMEEEGAEGAEDKGAIAAHTTPKDADATWDGPAEVSRMPNTASVLRAKHAWVDPDGDADAKSSYKFPHHPAGSSVAIRAAVNNAKARLSSANIPEGDRAGVLRHLEGHFASESTSEPGDGKQLSEDDINERRELLQREQMRQALRQELARTN